jgi:hypothetical protein
MDEVTYEGMEKIFSSFLSSGDTSYSAGSSGVSAMADIDSIRLYHFLDMLVMAYKAIYSDRENVRDVSGGLLFNACGSGEK